jgi:two-component system nitrogen regulation response regulator NtrX
MKRGKFELADKGTIFLDEIADMSLATQAKVLRVLEGQEFQRVGGAKTLKSDVRVIAASNKDLAAEIRKGSFREDLFYRLNVIPLEVPPLRERRGDIPVLVRYFLQEFAAEYGQKPKTIDATALDLFLRYPWNGNVRELRNFIERMMIMVPGTAITASEVPQPVKRPLVGRLSGDGRTSAGSLAEYATLKEARSAFEREYIIRKLKENNGNISRTADEIDVERSNLHRKIKALKIVTD